MSRLDELFFGQQVVNVNRRSVGSTPGFFGTGSTTSVALGATTSDESTSYVTQPAAVST